MYHGKDVEVYRENYKAGKEPDETPYGFHLASTHGYDVTFSRDIDDSPADLRGRILNKALHFPSGHLGLDVVHAYANRADMRDADVIWTMTEREAFAIGLLCSLGRISRRPLIANAIWLLDDWDRVSIHRKIAFRYLSRYIDVMTVHSQECLPIIRRQLPHLRSQLMYFGINTDVFRVRRPEARSDGEPIRIFAPGNDTNRDWSTLLHAFGNDNRFHVRIICPWLDNVRLCQEYSNLTMLSSPTMSDFTACYHWADIVAVPMRQNIYSGITVALEAAAMGTPVVSSRTGGVPTYFGEDEVLYSPAGDSRAMQDIVLSSDGESRRQRAERAQQRFLQRDYSTHGLIARYAELTRELLER
jgi:glycosyltransferase involved in cell wall biosynthesis